MSWFCGNNPCERSDCPYDLWAPDHRSKVTNVAFSAYAFHQQELTDYARELARVDDPNDLMTQRQIARDMNIRFDDLTDADIDYIAKEVIKQCVMK